MADNIETKVVLEADGSQLISTFDQLVNAITRTREELRQYKDDKEKTAELTQKLAEQEQQLVQLMAKNNNVIDSSNVSYKQLNDILKDLNKTYRQTSDAAQRMNIAPASKAINQELKTMDANIGNYQRNVGNYANDVEKAFNSVRMNATQVLRELPSMKYGIEMFFVAISNNLPMLVESLERLKAARAAEKAASAEQVGLDVAETKSKQGVAAATTAVITSKGAAAQVSVTEKNAEIELAKAEVEENQVTLQGVEADLEGIKASKAKSEANLKELKTIMELADAEKARAAMNPNKAERIASMQDASRRERAAYEAYMKLEGDVAAIEIREAETKEALAVATDKLTASQQRLNKAMAEGAAAGGAEAAGKAAGVAAKGFLSLANIVVLLVTVFALFSKQIFGFIDNLFTMGKQTQRMTDILDEMAKSMDAKEMSKFTGEVQKTTRALSDMNRTLVNSAEASKMFYKERKELNKAMDEGAKGMAKEYVELRLLDSIINDAAKSEEEHTKAAKKLLEIIDDTSLSTKDVTEQTEAYKGAIDELVNNLYKQAQAQGAVTLLQQKYTDTVLAAQSNLIDATLARDEQKFKSFWQGLGFWMAKLFTPATFFMADNKKDFLDNKVEQWKKKLDAAKTEFEVFLAEVSKMFNFDELFSSDNGGGGGKVDNWFSKWEMFIKRAETLQGTYVGEFQNLNLAETWKYSQAGMEAYMKKFDEYVAHYKGDTKQLKELEIQRLQYIEERYNYQQKLVLQWAHTDATEKQRELDQLEEWYYEQRLVYQTHSVDMTNLINEYNNRKEAIERKYVDKYVNVQLEGLDRELADLQVAFDNELYEYEKKGIETVNLEEHYAQERLKIISKYAKADTDAVIDELKREEHYRYRMLDVQEGWEKQGGKNRLNELAYARLAGTTMTGHNQRQTEINATYDEYEIWKESAEAQIEAMQEVLASGKLFGEDKLVMDAELAEAEKNLATGVAEYQMQLNALVLEDTRQTTEEMLGYIQSSFQGLGGAFNDIYSAFETMTDTQVKQGKISQEEAEKQLENYRGIKAASAAFDAFASAVSAYQSLAGIPVVGPGLGAIAAAAALAYGMAQVKNIMATTKNNIPSGTDTYANAMPSLNEIVPQYTINLTGKDDTDYLKNALTEKPIEAYVVESNITAAQEIANKRNNETSW